MWSAREEVCPGKYAADLELRTSEQEVQRSLYAGDSPGWESLVRGKATSLRRVLYGVLLRLGGRPGARRLENPVGTTSPLTGSTVDPRREVRARTARDPGRLMSLVEIVSRLPSDRQRDWRPFARTARGRSCCPGGVALSSVAAHAYACMERL